MAAIGVITAVTVLAYSNSVAGPFIFDDRSNIRDNLNIRRLWPVWEVLTARPVERFHSRTKLYRRHKPLRVSR